MMRLIVVENRTFCNEERQSFDVEGQDELELRRLLARIVSRRARAFDRERRDRGAK